MDAVLWVVWTVGLGVALVVGLTPMRRAALDRAADGLGRRSGLEPVPAVRDRIDRRLRLRRRWGAVSGVVALAAVLVLVAVVDGGRATSQSTWLLVGTSFASGAVGNAVAALRLGVRAREPGPRMARSRAVSIADYLPRAERVAARLLPLFGLVMTIAALLARAASPAVSVLGLALVAGSVLLFEVGARRAVRTPQRAGSADELAWDDAFRSSDVRALALGPMGIGAYVGLAAGWALDAGPAGAPPMVWGVLAALVLMVFALRSESQQVGRYFLRRLWPDTARALDVPSAAS